MLEAIKIFLSRVPGLYIGLHVKYLKKMPHIHTSSVNIITIKKIRTQITLMKS